VLASVRAVCEPTFDLTESQTTTHNLAPLIIVNGPARRDCGGFAAAHGALGPGHRANAAVGRALRLVLMNVGDARPGELDMALLGHPGKFTYCLAEDEESSPFPPLHVDRGFGEDESAVTVVAVDAPHSVVYVPGDDPADADRLVSLLGAVMSSPGSNTAYRPTGCVVLILNPDHAAVLAAAGYDRPRLQAALVAVAKRPRGHFRGFNPRGGIEPGEDDTELIPNRTPNDVIVVVAGGRGYYSAVMPSWGNGPHGNHAVSARIDYVLACDVPGVALPAVPDRHS
jgi:hypothetical protein